MTIRHGELSVAGATLYYEEQGHGTPVVLLHGFSLDRRMWDDQVLAWGSRYRIVRYDLRGFGRSTPSTQPYRHAEDLVALLDHLRIDRAFLVGLSLGGGAAINATIVYPNRVLGLIVVDPSLGGFRWSAAQTNAMNEIVGSGKNRGVDAARDKWLSLPIFRTLRANPPADARFRQMVAEYSGWHWVNADPGLPYAPPAIERLHEITAPTLVITGERDSPDFQQIALMLETRIPDARRVVLPGAGHLANMEAPDEFNAVVGEFLDQHTPAYLR
jgi:pimeloyl-ACP methyl ester carboxylesterase